MRDLEELWLKYDQAIKTKSIFKRNKDIFIELLNEYTKDFCGKCNTCGSQPPRPKGRSLKELS